MGRLFENPFFYLFSIFALTVLAVSIEGCQKMFTTPKTVYITNAVEITK